MPKLNGGSRQVLRTGLMALLLVGGSASYGQMLANASSKLEFDVASVRQNTSDAQPSSNFPLGPGAMYSETGGVFTARHQPVWIYIMFAYKMTDHEVHSVRKQLPGWALDVAYDIEARTESQSATKDEMRAMMQALLAERFKLTVHRSSDEVPVYALVQLTPGKLGPKLRVHPADDTSCSSAVPASGTPQTTEGGFPVICGGAALLPGSAPGRLAVGYRDVPLTLIAKQMSAMGGLERPVVDETGLRGNYDFALEFSPQLPPDVMPPPDYNPGPSFQQALAAQTGLKLVAQKADVEVIVVDHIERPSEN